MKTKLVVVTVLCVVLNLDCGFAQEKPVAETAPKQALTTANPEVPIGHLELLLDPLTRSELLVEAEGWRDLVKAKVQEISTEEIATREKTKEIEATEEIAETVAQPEAAETNATQQQEQKQESLETLTQLRDQRSALLERLKAVLDAYELKGGDPAELRQYAKAVSGLKVEVTDTSATWVAIKGWVVSKEGGIKWGFRLLQLTAIMLAFAFVAWIVGALVRKATSHNERMSDMLKRFLNTIAQRIILFIGLLVALSTLGVNVGALLALVGGGAFILGFALQDTLGNFAAGMMLLFYRPFDVGDVVEVGGVVGTVNNVSLVNASIRTFDNKVVLVPNKQVWGQVITNLTGAVERRVDMIFSISYSDDVDKAKTILEKIVSEHELVLKEPAPTVELHELGESSVNFVCRPWAKTADFWRVYWDITLRVKKAFDADDITIPFPQRDVYLHEVAGKSSSPATAVLTNLRDANVGPISSGPN